MKKIEVLGDLRWKAYTLFLIGMEYQEVLKAMKTVKEETEADVRYLDIIGIVGNSQFRYERGH